MFSVRRYLLVTSLLCFFSCPALSEAPVVDDSENFALLDEQQAAQSQPAPQYFNSHPAEEVALAHDDQEHHGATSNSAELTEKLQGVQQELQELRGQLELQAHQLETLKQQQIEFYKDLDTRLRQEPAPSGKTMSSTVIPDEPTINQHSALELPVPTTITPHGNSTDEQISYLAAYELIKNKQYDPALKAMQTFTTNYPQGGYTANAHYWLGELYMVKKDYPLAIQEFEVVLSKFPSSSKSSASLLKIGYALAASGKTDSAKQKLQGVIKRYPDTHAAALALAKLESINSK